jgi:DNA-binding MarR family transcriptional regulator
MKNKILLKLDNLIHEFDEFISTNDSSSMNWLSEFGNFLEKKKSTEIIPEHHSTDEKDIMTGMFIVSLMTLAKNKFNKLIRTSPFSTIMDYQFLLVLDTHGKQTKSELIALNNMEISSGIEVIKRLLKNNWISEMINKDDLRSKYVIISDSGKKILLDYQSKVNQVYSSFCLGLSTPEREKVLSGLNILIKQISNNF